MTPDKVEAALGTFIEQMDILRDDFVRYQEGQKSVPFVVLRESLIAALNAYDESNLSVLTEALAERERDAARYRWLRNDPPVSLCVRRHPGETERGCYLDGLPLDHAIDTAMKDTDHAR